jgi:hypothetical protein
LWYRRQRKLAANRGDDAGLERVLKRSRTRVRLYIATPLQRGFSPNGGGWCTRDGAQAPKRRILLVPTM